MASKKDSVRYERLVDLWKEARDEIKQRISQRDRYVMLMMVGFVALIGASKFVPGAWLLSPLPLFYYSIMTLHSYLIHKQLSSYMSDQIERKIKDTIVDNNFDYLEYESYFKITGASVGVRKWLFKIVPMIVGFTVVAYLLVFSLGTHGKYMGLFLPVLPGAVLVCLIGDALSQFYPSRKPGVSKSYPLPCVAAIFIFVVAVSLLVPVLREEEINGFFKDKYDILIIYTLVFPVMFALWNSAMLAVEEKINLVDDLEKYDIGIVGFGEVVRDKYLPLLSGNNEFATLEVFAPDLEKSHYKKPIELFYDRLYQRSSQPDIWIIATPTPSHYEYFRLLRDFGIPCAIEKPAVNCSTQYKDMRANDFGKDQSTHWFPMAYYLLEKGLPLLLLLDRAFSEDCNYKSLVHIDFTNGGYQSLSRVRDHLGKIVDVSGLIMEGETSNALTHRRWVLEREGKGNTWETLFHLVCMVFVANHYNRVHFNTGHTVALQDAHRYTFDIDGKESYGDIGAYVSLKCGDDPNSRWRIATAKMVDSTLNMRHVQINFDSEFSLMMDFEACKLTLYSGSTHKKVVLTIRLKLQRKYQTQMELMKRWLHTKHTMPLPMRVYDEALLLTEKIAQVEVERIPEMINAGQDDLVSLARWDQSLFDGLDVE